MGLKKEVNSMPKMFVLYKKKKSLVGQLPLWPIIRKKGLFSKFEITDTSSFIVMNEEAGFKD